MAEDDKVLAALAALKHEMNANFQMVGGEVKRLAERVHRLESDEHTKAMRDHRSALPSVEELSRLPLPREKMTTLDEIDSMPVSQSIRAMKREARWAKWENRIFTLLVLVVVPLAIAWMQRESPKKAPTTSAADH
jgi:hypothetical protein